MSQVACHHEHQLSAQPMGLDAALHQHICIAPKNHRRLEKTSKITSSTHAVTLFHYELEEQKELGITLCFIHMTMELRYCVGGNYNYWGRDVEVCSPINAYSRDPYCNILHCT